MAAARKPLFPGTYRIEIGQSYADISGEFALGLDEQFGPTVGIGMQLANVYLHPNDMDAPEKTIPNIVFNGWSAPVYGAIGIDKVTIDTGEYNLQADGRVDILQAGIGAGSGDGGPQCGCR